MRRTILIVDDVATNRRVLRKILSEDYEILEAQNGVEALDTLRSAYKYLSAVLLDIVMPVMDGYAVLEEIRKNPELAQIPIIVTTGNTGDNAEIKALTLGANDFIAKPYVPDVIKRRLKNTINLRETAATVNALQRDKLTGLYNRETFFQKAADLIRTHPPGYYVLGCFDIDNFKVVNDQYGSQKGDEVLKHVASIFRKGFDAAGGLVSRITADNFAVLYPASLLGTDTLAGIRNAAAVPDGSLPPLSFSVGRYIVSDLSLPVSAMYDRARLAEASVKGRFDTHIAEYDESMRDKLLHEQEILNEMRQALVDHQFEVWFQPQYNHSTGALVGGEALVRWRHPTRGLVMPGEFIPVFERNGFIYEMDKYVWEQTCVMLRKWLDAGQSPLPISVNVSRYDVLRGDLMDTITGLVQQYGIPIDLLRLEITESAFAKSTDQIIRVVQALIDYGFTMEIDDFGSGYSSLNTLKDVPAQIVKLDMRFLEGRGDTGRGGNILESVVRMAKWLGMSVIAEGVETAAQADYLKSIGCNYVQGYLYGKPLPAAEYEALARNAAKEEKLISLETVENLNNNAFWNPESMDTLIFNSYVGGACIFEYHNGSIELLRATDKFARTIGSADMTVADALKLNWAEHIAEESRPVVKEALELSIGTGDEVVGEFVFMNLPGCPEKTYLRSALRVIASAGNRYLVYCTNENITAQREAEKKEQETAERMRAVMENVSSGITAVITHGEHVEYLFVNDRYYEMLGYTREQYEAEVTNTFDLIHPDDRQWVLEAVERINATGAPAVLEYRVIRRDGTVMWERNSISITRFEGIAAPVQLGVAADVTAEKHTAEHIRALNENLQNMMNDMPGGFLRLRMLPDSALVTEYANQSYCRLRGLSPDQLPDAVHEDVMQVIHPDDRALFSATVAEMIETGESRNAQCRLQQAGGAYIPVSVFGRVSDNEAGECFINMYFADLTEQEKKDFTVRETMPFILSAIMKASPDSTFAKDRDLRYICCSPTFVRIAGKTSERDVIGKSDYDLFPKETADLFRESDTRLMESGQSLIGYLEPIPSQDGIQHYSETSKHLLRDTLGNIIGLYGIGRDITQERTAFEQLKLLTDSIPGGIATYAVTPDGMQLRYFNDGFCRTLGATREEYEQHSSKDPMGTIFEEDRRIILEQLERLLRDDTPIDCVFRVRPIRGEGFKWVNLRGVVSGRSGDTVFVNTVQFDVTESRLAQETALIHEQEMQLAMSKMGRMICEYDPTTHTLTVPEAYAALYKLSSSVPDVPDSLIRAGVIAEETLPAYRAFYEAILRGDATGFAEYRDRRPDGSEQWERAEFSTIFDSDGKPVKTIIAVEDTTEQHRQYELEQSRPSMGEENLLVHALFNLNTGETLDYAYPDGREVPPDERTAFLFGGDNLETIIINDEERERYRELNDPEKLLARYEQGETELSIDYRRLMPDGEVIWVRNLLHMIPEPGGSDILLFEYCYDIEEETTRELMYSSLVNEDYEYVARINGRNGHFSLLISDAARDGLLPERGEDFDTFAAAVARTRTHPDDLQMVLQNLTIESMQEHLLATERFRFSFRSLLPDGEVRYKRMTQYYLDRERDIIIMTREDVTALMQEELRKNELLETALKAANEESRVKAREAAERLEVILNSVNGGISATAMIDGRVRYLFANEEFYTMYGYSREHFQREFINGMLDLVHPDDLQKVRDAMAETAEKGTAKVDARVYRSDGRMIWVRNISSACTIAGIDAPVFIVVSSDITSEREAADNLRMSEEQFRIAAAIGGRTIARYDIKTHVFHHNDPILMEAGFTERIENMPQAFIDAGIIAPEFIPAYRAFYDRIGRGEESCSLDTLASGRDGVPCWIHADATVIFDESGTPSQAIIVFSDVTEQREKEAVYKRWQQSLQQRPKETYTLFRCNLSKDSSFEAAEGSLLHVPFAANDATFNERTQEYVRHLVYQEDRENYLAFLNADTLLANYYRGVRVKSLEYRELQPDNGLRWLRLTIELVEYPNSSDIEAYLMYEDIDENKQDELRTKKRAETDPLTGVLNRTAFSQAVEHRIAGPNAVGSLALLMLDIDGFKLINDTFGHAKGDQVLLDIVKSLRAELRHGDMLGRLGGDEFLICLPGMTSEGAIKKKAAQICSLLHKALSPEVCVSVSLGIAVYPRDGKDFETLYRKMDVALYTVKKHGKNNYAFYREGMACEDVELGGLADDAEGAKPTVQE